VEAGVTDDEIKEAWQFVNRMGPANAWTATNGTAARIIGRLLKEVERLREIEKEWKEHTCLWGSDPSGPWYP
jgi:hypothetical protein